jgi:hypothetical protein
MTDQQIAIVDRMRAEIAPIAAAGTGPYPPFCRRLYAAACDFDFSCCVSPFPCLFNYPRHAGRHEHRGAIMRTVSLPEAASRDVRMLRGAIGPAITSNIVTAMMDIQDAYIARVTASFKKVTPHTRGNRFGWATCIRVCTEQLDAARGADLSAAQMAAAEEQPPATTFQRK